MTYGEALLYGAVQGITEYLPISSSAHLILLPKFLGAKEYGLTFDVFLHLGTLMSTLIYFWRDWLEIFRTMPVIGPMLPVPASPAPPGPGKPQSVDWSLIAIATVPALVAGAVLRDYVETVFRGNAIQMATLVIGGLLLYLSDRLCRGDRGLVQITRKDALLVGIAQCFALVPGMSRSGSTMTGGRLLGFDRATAARFSFLISAPITAAALVFELRNWRELFESEVGIGPLLTAGVSSFLFGCIAIGGLIRMLRRFGYFSFFVYRAALAVVIWQVLGF